MNAFVQQNRGLLKFYCVGSQIIGWMLLAVSPVGTIIALSGDSSFNENALVILYILQAITLNPIILGLLVLGIAQFIRYVAETEYKPGWILRSGSTILYAAAFIVFLNCIMNYLFFSFFAFSINAGRFSMRVNLFTSFIPAAAKILILVGLGQILRRIMPVIEESKTLV